MLLNMLRRLDLPRADDLSAKHLYHLIAAYVLISLPMLTLFPIWVILTVLLTVGIKITAIRQHWRLSKWWILPLMLMSVMMVVGNARHIGLDYFSVALLFIFASLKLLEAREERDAFMLMLVNLLLMMGALMAHDGPVVFVYLVFCFFYNVYIQLHIAQPKDLAISWRQNSKTLVKIFIISLPFVIGLFFLFPRIGPLWRQVPTPQAVTGLSDEMTADSLSELSQDSGLAFRVKFKGSIPDNPLLYWRGPVLSDFDGKTWRRDPKPKPLKTPVTVKDSAIDYTVYHHGETGRWVLPLDMPRYSPPQTTISQDYEISMEVSKKPRAFQLSSYPRYRTPPLTDEANRYHRLLPVDIFPKTRELAANLARQSQNIGDFADRVLAYFRYNDFYYDLAPPVGNVDLDTFLLTNRSGYCQHYASAFTFMMRSQGVPARVVMGYQGGAINAVSKEWEVRHYNAHAWSEIYFPDKGWVRYDPTAAIAPERVNSGTPFGSVRNSSRIALGARWENQSDLFRYASTRLRAMRAFWQNWIINYDSDKQRSLWQRLGLSRYKDFLWVGFVIILTPIIAVLILLYRYRQRKNQGDAISKAMQPFIKTLKKAGLVKPDSMPWQTFVAENSQLSQGNSKQVIKYYYQLRYQDIDVDKKEIKRLQQLIKQFIKQFSPKTTNR